MDVLLTPRAWRGYRRGDFPSDSWEIRGEILHAIGGRAQVSLVSQERYGDFDVSLEWRLAIGGNSGILYRVSEDYDEPWQSGPEMQLLDNANHADGRVPETWCGALYGLQAPEHVPQCPPGLYNIARVSVRAAHVEHWLNGVKVVEYELWSPDWERRVRESKFNEWPAYGRARRGHIALQDHGDWVAYRNIKIKVLP